VSFFSNGIGLNKDIFVKRIDILLSTYNGEFFLADLLDSLLQQSNQDWRLVIRDDQSTDNTLKLIKKYGQSFGDRIIVIADEAGHLGPSLSFGKLLEYSKAPYVMLCDQDDIWLTDKIESSLKKMSILEEKFGPQMPSLVFMNSSLINEQGCMMVEDAWKYMGIQPEVGQHLKNVILRNIFMGHAMMMNRSLVELALPIPAEALMHDWWIGLVASSFGRIDYIPKPGVLYRQHPNNVLGLKKVSLLDFLFKYKSSYRNYVQFQQQMSIQTKCLCSRFEDLFTKRQRSLNFSEDIDEVRQFASLKTMNIVKRKLFLLNFYKNFPYRDKALMDILWY
jgi:glycosyltransferase involved in cell wall biosynthesis